MTSPVAELLFNEYRRRVLSLLLLNPDRAYHVREIARLTATQAGTLHKELTRLAAVGILEKHAQGNQLSYKANKHSIIFSELASIMRKTSGLADVLIDALMPLRDDIVFAWIYGSMASGKAHEYSDIDLLVVGEVEYQPLIKALYPCQERLAREINPKLYRLPEWQAALANKDSFVLELLDKPLIKLFDSAGDNTQSLVDNKEEGE